MSAAAKRRGWNEAAHAGPARLVVGKSEPEHDGEPKNGAHDDQLRALRTVTRVHEVKDNKGGLRRGDAEGDDNVKRAKIPKGGPHGEGGADNQREEDDDINFRRNDVFGVLGMLSHAIFS